MQYMGGKTRIAKQIAAEIDKVRKPGQLVWDAFCGGLSVSVALSKKGPVLASDACLPLISLYKAVQEGWDPPTEVSKETWQAAKLLPDTDPMKAFCGFGCSFGGIYFSSYAAPKVIPKSPTAHGGKTDYAGSTRRALLRDCVPSIEFKCIDFFMHIENESSIIYCDIPYNNVTGYKAATFDRDKFIEKVESFNNKIVFISEYDFPLGEVIWERNFDVTLNCGIKGSRNKVIEKLYLVKT